MDGRQQRQRVLIHGHCAAAGPEVDMRAHLQVDRIDLHHQRESGAEPTHIACVLCVCVCECGVGMWERVRLDREMRKKKKDMQIDIYIYTYARERDRVGEGEKVTQRDERTRAKEERKVT